MGEAERLYDDFIDTVFGQKSTLSLLSQRAFYDESNLEDLMFKYCGDELLIDSNQQDCSKIFCVSTRVNNNPPIPWLWRNYNYPHNSQSRYPGAFRVNTVTAVR